MDAMTVKALSYDDGILRITPVGRPPGLRLSGELDLGGMAGLATALAGVARVRHPGDAPFQADLSGLTYIGVCGLRMLIDAGLLAGPDGPGLIVMVSPSAVVRRLLWLTEWGRYTDWDQPPDPEQAARPDVELVDGGG